jgi:multisubunit Na+/H+ antiporter MnhB subunit
MQFTTGLINDLIVFAIFIYLCLLVNGKIKMREERQARFDDLMLRRGRAIKILIYSGTALIGIIILITLFSFVPHGTAR